MQALPSSLVQPVNTEHMLQPEAFLQLLPSLFDAQTEQAIKTQITSQAIKHTLEEAKANLAGVLGAVTSHWLAVDPLNFKRFIIECLPNATGNISSNWVSGYPLSPDRKHLLLLLRPIASAYDAQAAQALMAALHTAISDLHTPTLKATIVGSVRHTAANTTTINHDIAYIVGFSLLGFSCTYLILVRSIGLIWLLLTPCVAVSWSIACLSFGIEEVSGLALGFGVSVLGIAEDYAVHMHFASRCQNARIALSCQSWPLLQGLLLNMTGFVVLCFSAIPAVQQIAIFSLLTLCFGYLLAVTVLPLCPYFATPKLQVNEGRSSKAQPNISRLYIVALILVTLSFACLSQLHIDVSPKTFGADMAAISQDTEALHAIWGKQTSSLIVVDGQDIESCMTHLKHIQAYLPKSTNSLADLYLPQEIQEQNQQRWLNFVQEYGFSLNKELLSAGQALGFTPAAFSPFYKFLKTKPAFINQDLLAAAGFKELLATFLQVTPNACRTLCFLEAQHLTSFKLPELPQELAKHCTLLSPKILEQELLKLFASETPLVPVALLSCVLLLAVFFRRLTHMCLAALPLLCALAAILACHVVLAKPLTLASLAAMPLVLGLATDHGVLLTHDVGLGLHLGTQRAILVSSLTALTSMGLLACASHPSLSAMGLVVFVGLLTELLATLLLIPFVCSKTTFADQNAG